MTQANATTADGTPAAMSTYLFDHASITTIEVKTAAGEAAARHAASALQELNLRHDDISVAGDVADDVCYTVTCVSPYGKGWLVQATDENRNDLDVITDGAYAVPLDPDGEYRDELKDAAAAWYKAANGDSGDAEYEAGSGMADVICALLGIDPDAFETVPVIWYVYRDPGASPVADDGPVNPGEAGVDIPDEVLEWATGHGLSESDPDVYVLVAREDDAPDGEITGQLAARDGTVSTQDGERITSLLDRERAAWAEQRNYEREVYGT